MKRKGLFLVATLAIMTFGTVFTYIVPKKYEASSIVFIEKGVLTQLVQGIAIAPSMDDSIRVLTAALSSRTLIEKVIKDVNFDHKTNKDFEIEGLITELQKNTQVKVVNKDQFRVTFKHTDPKIARDYVNTLVHHYIEGENSSKKTESADASNFLTEQIAAHKKKMAEIEAEVSQYKISKNAVVSLNAGEVFRDINLEQQKLFDLQLRKKQLEEEKKYVRVASDPASQKLSSLLKKLDELRALYTENYPEIINLKAQIESLQEELKLPKSPNSHVVLSQELWKIDAELKAIQENEASIQRHIAANKALLASIPSSQNTLEKLEAAKATQKTMHDLLAMRSSQAEMSKQMGLQEKGTNFRIVDPAVVPVNPVSPNRKKLLLMSIVAGFAGGASILLLLEKLDDSVKLVDTLKQLDLPVLAVIPLIKSKEEVLIEKQNDLRIFAISGAYFSLIIAIFLMEVLGISLFEKIVEALHLPRLFSSFFKA